MKNNNFENQIVDKFESFSVKPPEMVWSNIEKEINKKKENTITKFFASKYFWIMFLGLSSLSIAYHLNEKKINDVVSSNVIKDDSSAILVSSNDEYVENIEFDKAEIKSKLISEPGIRKNKQTIVTNKKSSVSDINKQLIIITEHFYNPDNGFQNVRMSLSDTLNIKHVDWVCRSYDFYSSEMTLPIAFSDSAESYEIEAVVTFKDDEKKLFTTEVSVMNPPRVVVPQNFNPNRHPFYIRCENLSYFKIEIINPRTNKSVFKSTSVDKKWNGKDLRGKKCESGEYFVEINFKGSTGEIRTEITKLRLSY